MSSNWLHKRLLSETLFNDESVDYAHIAFFV